MCVFMFQLFVFVKIEFVFVLFYVWLRYAIYFSIHKLLSERLEN